MKNFLTGAFFITTTVVLFWTLIILAGYIWYHTTEVAHVIFVMIFLPAGVVSVLFGHEIGQNFHNWRKQR